MIPLYLSLSACVLLLVYTFFLATWMKWAEGRTNMETEPGVRIELWDEFDCWKLWLPTHWVRTYWKWRVK